MDEQQLKTHIRNTFDTVAEGYGSTGIDLSEGLTCSILSVLVHNYRNYGTMPA
jgi:hypothetical protein